MSACDNLPRFNAAKKSIWYSEARIGLFDSANHCNYSLPAVRPGEPFIIDLIYLFATTSDLPTNIHANSPHPSSSKRSQPRQLRCGDGKGAVSVRCSCESR